MAISGKELEDIVRPELREEFEEEKKELASMEQVGIGGYQNKELADTVHPELKVEFAAKKKGIGRHGNSGEGRIPGLFKQEFAEERMIALCSKCYFADGPGRKAEAKHKRDVQEAKTPLPGKRFKAALEGNKDMATNRGFRMREGEK